MFEGASGDDDFVEIFQRETGGLGEGGHRSERDAGFDMGQV
jgi:hypothetical protein